MTKVDVKVNKAALSDVIKEGIEANLKDFGLTHKCPECGKDIPIEDAVNVCECGFTLNVVVEDPKIS